MPVTTPKALLFDVQGTVTEFFYTIRTALQQVCSAHAITLDWSRFVNDWRAAYSSRIAQSDPAHGWQRVHDVYRTALDDLLITYGATQLDESDREELTRAWQQLLPWPDTLEGLSLLRQRYTIAALSNADVSAVIRISKGANLPWDAIFTAEMAGAFKPAPQVYRMAARYLGLEPSDIMMVASHKYDLRGAASQGFRTAFLTRPLEYGPDEHPDVTHEDTFDINANSLVELAKLLEL